MQEKLKTYKKKKNRNKEVPEFRIIFRVFDPELMNEVRAKAKRDNTTIAETIRILVTWGLEDEYLMLKEKI